MNLRSLVRSTASGLRRPQTGALLNHPSDAALIIVAMLVGASTGLTAVLFIQIVSLIAEFVHSLEDRIGSVAALLLAMGGAGLLVGLLIDHFATEVKGSGVPEVMEAVAVRGGRIRPRVALAKVLASSLTIGTGGSAGREGPIVQVGSALGSAVAQLLQLSTERTRTLVACGAAAGVAATFNAPIAGAIFALEVILGRFTVRYFGAVVISAVSGAVISQTLLSPRPAFQVPSYPFSHLAELPIYIALSILAALLAVLFIRFFSWAGDVSDRIRAPLPLKTMVGMLLTASIALILPGREVLGPGLELIGETIAGDFDLSLRLMGLLLVLKLLATTATLGTGNSGGVFAPSLFMGATLGGIVGTVGQQLWPTVVDHPGAYAIVGMAAVFSAAARAPMTAILIVFEMSGDYQLILPLMLATVLATLLAELLFPESIYTLKLSRRGIQLAGGRVEDVLASVPVREVMQAEVDTLPAQTTLDELARNLSRSHHHGYPILDEEQRLVGLVTLTDLDRALDDNLPRNTPVSVFATPRESLITVNPESSIGEALQQMGRRGLGRIPVVESSDPQRLVGLIRRESIITAYDLALTDRAKWQHRAKQLRHENLDATDFVDVLLADGDAAVGQTIAGLGARLPDDCVLVAIRRRGQILIPHGHTTLQAGDQVTAFINHEERQRLFDCLR